MSAPASTYAHARSMADCNPSIGQRIRSRHEHEVGIGSGIHRSLDTVDHFRLADEHLARAVATALGLYLILDMHRTGARFNQGFHRACDIESACAEAGIRVHQQGQVRRVGNPPYIGQHIIKR